MPMTGNPRFFIAALAASHSPSAQAAAIIHDAEYYVLEAQYAEN